MSCLPFRSLCFLVLVLVFHLLLSSFAFSQDAIELELENIEHGSLEQWPTDYPDNASIDGGVDRYEVAFWLSTLADQVSTEFRLSDGAIEGNVLMRRRDVRIAAAVGTSILFPYLYRRWGRPKLLLLLPTSLHLFATGWNVSYYISF